MTNLLLPDRSAGLDAELLALASSGGKRRPVKVVEHPAFAPRRRLRADALLEPFTVLRLPVVSLDPTRPCPPTMAPCFPQAA
jgi:hypothetical protein